MLELFCLPFLFSRTLDALRPPLFTWNFNFAKVYSYPTNRQSIFRIPDEVLIRNLGHTQATVSIFHSVAEYNQQVVVQAGLTYNTTNSNSTYTNTSSTCVNERAANPYPAPLYEKS